MRTSVHVSLERKFFPQNESRSYIDEHIVEECLAIDYQGYNNVYYEFIYHLFFFGKFI